ncbi:ACT domain-containing protein [Undibacterium arcticum]
MIYGSEGIAIQLAPCCLPIPGDGIIGLLKRDQGLMVHTADCEQAKRQRAKEPDRWIDVVWGEDLNRRFDCHIQLLIHNQRGILARVAAEIGEADANITYVGMGEDNDSVTTHLRFTVQIEDRIHLARLMRNLRRIPGVIRLLRERG